MNGGPVARPDSMTKGKRATGSRDIGQASLLVSPGEDLGDSEGKEPGHGVISMDGRLKAVKAGRLRDGGETISVMPTHTTYFPRPGDLSLAISRVAQITYGL